MGLTGSVTCGNMLSSVEHLTCCYAEVVHWKRNLFKIPAGKAGNSFVKEITRLLRAYTEASVLESVALKAVMVMPHLLLQKSHHTSKAKDHVAQLERRLETWANGDLDQLLHEGRTIQKQLSSGPNKTPSHDAKVAHRFSKLMMEGKVKAALRLITDQERGGLLPLDSVASSEGTTTNTVRDILLEKHPSAQPPFPSAICEPSETIYEPHSVCFDRIDGSLIRNTVLRMDWAAGPSSMQQDGNVYAHPFAHILLTCVKPSPPLRREFVRLSWIQKD